MIPLADRVGALPTWVRDVLLALLYLAAGLLLAWSLPEGRIGWWGPVPRSPPRPAPSSSPAPRSRNAGAGRCSP
ncbi:hypothetical protein [Pseudonocardia sp. NPDC049154]|uniref:hypothetical protein n=1 Tax=Pseudonocardia sp. NPDC049154 TaxID=3155501 RepID=UPI0033D04359